MNPIYQTAHELLQAGVLPIPVRADGSKAPALRSWQNHRTTEQDIETWFGGLTPTYDALGIVTGPASGNLEMAEIEGEYAHEIPALMQLADDTGLGSLWAKICGGWTAPLAGSWVEQSPSGGIHWFYRVDGPNVPGNTKLAQDVPRPNDKGQNYTPTIAETRGKGGQTVGAPTGGHAHPTGRPWTRLSGGPATLVTLTLEEREQFHALLGTLDRRPAPTPRDTSSSTSHAVTGVLGGLERDHRRRTSLDGTTPGDDYEQRTTWRQLLEPAGWTILFQRGSTTYWTRPGKNTGISATTGHADDRDRLYVFSSSTDFPTFEPITKFGAYAILEHGGDHAAAARKLRATGYGEPARVQHPAAQQQPQQAQQAQQAQPAQQQAQQAQQAAATNVVPMPAPAPADHTTPLHLVTTTLDLTDDANAMELIRLYGERIRYNSDQGRWLIWSGHHWEVQPRHGGAARELAKAAARQLPDDGPEGRDKVLRHKRYSLSERGTTALLNTARTDPTISVTTDNLDAHPLELNTPGGIVDLATGNLRPSDPSRLHTRSTTCTPDPNADPTAWHNFLAQTFPDPDVRQYIQRLVGHSILGEVRAHVLPFAFGSGGNGKGVFLEALHAILGNYAGSAPAGFLMSSQFQQHATELADLAGRRFVICSEINQGDRFDEAKVKALTGGDTVKARFMRQDFFEFSPTHHLWLMGNDQPAVESGGNSFWRRLRLIPFTNEVPDDQRVDDLQGILAREHGPAILHWAIQGATQFLAHGMAEPEGVKAATTAYAENVDTIGRFLEDECLLTAGYSSPVTQIRAAYEDWCKENGERPITGRRFASQLARHGVQVGRDAPRGSTGARMYGGIALIARQDEEEQPTNRGGAWGSD